LKLLRLDVLDRLLQVLFDDQQRLGKLVPLLLDGLKVDVENFVMFFEPSISRRGNALLNISYSKAYI